MSDYKDRQLLLLRTRPGRSQQWIKQINIIDFDFYDREKPEIIKECHEGEYIANTI